MVKGLIVWGLILFMGQAGAENQLNHRDIIKDMSWLAGHWSGTFEGKPFEAIYTSPTGGVIMSVSKEFGDSEPCFFEFEKFELLNDTLVMTPYPSGEKSDDFPLIDYSRKDKRAVFENKNHDFPTTFMYTRTSDDSLKIIVSGEIKGERREFKVLLKKNDKSPGLEQ